MGTNGFSDFGLQSIVLFLAISACVFYSTAGALWWIADKAKCPKLKQIVEIVTSFMVFLDLLPIILLICILNEILRLILNAWIHWSSNGRISLIPSGPDAAWGFENAMEPSTVTFMLIFKGKGDLKKLQSHLEKNALNKMDESGSFPFSKLRKILVTRCGYYCWMDSPALDIQDHVKYAPGIKSADDFLQESNLNGIFSHLTNTLFDDGKPQWEILLVPNLKYGDDVEAEVNHYGVIFRMHHTLGDAISWLQMIKYGVADNNNVELSIDPLTPLGIPKWRICLSYLMVLVLGPRSLFKFFTSSDKNVLYTRKRLTGPKYTVKSKQIDLKLLKKIKNKSGTSITAVINSCVAGGLRKYFVENKESSPVPMEIKCVTTGAMLPYPDYFPKNRFSIVPLPLAVGLEKLEDRLKASSEAAINFYHGPELPLYYSLSVFFGRFPKSVIASVWKLGQATIAFSNIPGPSAAFSACGGDICVDAFGCTPIKCYTGLSLCTLSYLGNVRFSILADHVAVKSEENCVKIMQYIEEELDSHVQIFLGE